jgi:lysophospholipase L1-like esterase
MSEPSRWQGRLANAFMLLVSLVLTVAVLEFAARFWLMNLASPDRFSRFASLRQLEAKRGEDAWAEKKYAPHRYIGYVPTANWSDGDNRHNALGFRGDEIMQPKPADEFRIVCLGGSTTYTMYCEDYRLAYPALLETELRARGHENVLVINGGAEGWSSYESFVNLAFRVMPLEPDCIVVYHAINDMFGRLVWPPEVYTADNGGWKRPLVSEIFMPPWYEHSTLVRILLVKSGIRPPHDALRETVNPRAGTSFEYEFERQVREGVYPAGIFEEVSAAEMFAANPPVHFQRNMANIARLARDNGVAVIFATFAYSPHFSDEPHVASDEYRYAYAEMNAAIRNAADSAGANLFDFADEFPDDTQYYVDGYHVNEAGSALKAKLFADFVVESGILRE